MSEGIVSVLLTDDQTLIRDGLKALLGNEKGISVLGEAADGNEAVEKALELRPDIVLMDIRMPGMDGVEATRIIKQKLPETKVIILTTFDDDDYIIKAMSYGASGYLLKDIESGGLVSAIRNCIRGNIILPGKIAEKITSRLNDDRHDAKPMKTDDFTEREMEIIILMTKGMSNAEIAEKLYLTNGTVKNYVSQIYMKIDVRDRANAVLYFKNNLNI